MNKFISYIFSICVIAVFLLSTSGFTIYSHHCSDNDTSYSYSFIKTQDNCNQCNNNNQPDNKNKGCCTTTLNCEFEKLPSNCCTSDGNYMKIIVEFIVPANDESNLRASIDEIELVLFDKVNVVSIPMENKPLNYSLPPPKTGAEIVILLNQRKTSPLPSGIVYITFFLTT